jgi:hypothetical protein
MRRRATSTCIEEAKTARARAAGVPRVRGLGGLLEAVVPHEDEDDKHVIRRIEED